MATRGRIVLGSRVAGAVGRILVDRLEEGVDRALPRTPEQLARPEVVNRLIHEHRPRGAAALPAVHAVDLPGVEFESSNCRNFLIEPEFEHQPNCDREGLPRSLYAKLPCPEFATRAFANAVGFWETETWFCRHLASQVPVRVPRPYAVARRGARFVLLLENLHETPGVRLFINRDMAAGTTPDRARMCLESFADLHARYWGSDREKREALFPLRLHTYLAPGGRDMTRALNAAAIGPAHSAAPDVFTREHVALCRRAIDKWDDLVDAWYREPLTLIHGDSHLANCFEYPTPEGPRMGMIDFQGMQWCKGIRDLQYFLVNSLEPDVLAACEEEMIDAYTAALAKRSVSLDARDAREQYRAFSFQTLMVAVVSIGLGSLTEREDTVRTVLRRSVAAVERLDFGGWLDGLCSTARDRRSGSVASRSSA